MASLNHICGEGQTWGYLAHKYYGTIAGIKILVEANPTVPVDAVLPYGTTLVVPIVKQTDDAVITQNLPPWK